MLASLPNQLITSAGQILLVPLFLVCWGQEMYGEWLTLAAAVGYLAVLDLGMQTHVVNRLNASYTRGELADYTRILHSSLFWSLLLAGTASVIAIMVGLYAPLSEWFAFSTASSGVVPIVVTLLAAQIAISVPSGIITGVYRTVGEMPRGVMLGNAQRVARFGLTALVLVFGGGLASVAIAQLLPTALAMLWALRDLRSRHLEIEFGLHKRDFRLALSQLRPSLLFSLVQGAMVITLQGSVLLVGLMFGVGAVAVFVSLRMLANLARQLAGIITNILWPDVTSLDAQGAKGKLREVHLFSVKATTLLACCAGVFLHFFGADLVQLWTAGRLEYDAALMDAFALLVALQTPWMTSMYLLLASNQHQRLSAYYMTAALAGLGLAAIFAGPFGPAGVLYGIGLAELAICGFTIPAMSCRSISQSYSMWLMQIFGRGVPVALLLYFATQWFATQLAFMNPIMRIAAALPFVSAIAFVLTFGLWLERSERQRAREVVTRLIGKRTL
jgi:O-antigen/teichoic acid export membrane protein